MRKLAIVGSHTDGRDRAPYDDPSYEIWVFNEAPQVHSWVKRWDATFQLHDEDVYTSPNNFVAKDHWQWLQQDHGDKVIWMQHYDPRVPNCRVYPLDEVIAMCGRRYVRSSPAYAIALGILLEYDEIKVYGINLVSNTEYRYQAVNAAYWIGFAEGRGVNLIMECWHDEFRDQRLYAYDGQFRLDKSYFEARIAELEPTAANNERELRRVKGRLDDALMKFEYQKVSALMVELEGVALTAGETSGALAVAENYGERTENDSIPRQEFERRMAEAQRDGPPKRAQMYHEGGKCEYVWNVWSQTGNPEARAQLRKFCNQKIQFAYETGLLSGQWSENLRYMNEYDDRITAAGGDKALLAVGA
jgi:hypothetical protein